MTDILDIEGIVRPFWERHLEALGLAAAVLLFFFVLALILKAWFLRRRSLKKLPSHEAAMVRLNELDRQQWIEAGEFRKYYFALSEILKIYLEGRYAFPATDMTTEELRLSGFDLPLTFFERADLIKFAELIPGESQAKEDRQMLSSFIKSTTPNE